MTMPKGVHLITIPTPWQVGDINAYVLRDGGIHTLVDTGPLTEEAEQALEAGLAEIGLLVEDLDQVVLTHFHVDHSGLLEKIVQRSGAKTYAHPSTQMLIKLEPEFLQLRESFYKGVYRAMGLEDADIEEAYRQLADYQEYMGKGRIDVELAEGDVIPGHEDWQVVYTPGHSQDHLSLHRAKDGVMLLGDHLIRHISSNAMIEPALTPGAPRPHTLVAYREALRKVQAMEWHIGYTGHGEPITDHRALIEKRLRSQEKRAAWIVQLIREGTNTGAELARTLFPKHQNQLSLIVSEILGHLDWLVEQGVLAVETDEDGVWRYSVLAEEFSLA